jgi:choline kinase
MVESLFRARAELDGGAVVAYGDIAYRADVLRALLAEDVPAAVVVDRAWRGYWALRFDDPLADAESLRIGPDGNLVSIGQRETDIDRIEAQYIGLMAFRGEGLAALDRAYAAVRDERMFMTDLLQAMVDAGDAVRAVAVDGGWVEIDSVDDLRLAERLVKEGRLG